VAAIELDEIIGLQNHVIEFQERQFLLSLQPQFHRIETEHAIDRKMPADIAQEIDIVERIQPIGIVRHDRIVPGRFAGRAKAQETRKDRANAFEVFVDIVVRKQPPAFVLAGRIADARGAAPHQGDRTMSGLLQPVQQHDRQQGTDMQRRRGAVEADIAGNRRRTRQRVERLGLGDLMDESSRGEHIEKIGLVGAHRGLICARSFPKTGAHFSGSCALLCWRRCGAAAPVV